MFKLIARIFLIKQVIDFFRSRQRTGAGRRR
jgi:hypothetical protein